MKLTSLSILASVAMTVAATAQAAAVTNTPGAGSAALGAVAGPVSPGITFSSTDNNGSSTAFDVTSVSLSDISRGFASGVFYDQVQTSVPDALHQVTTFTLGAGATSFSANINFAPYGEDDDTSAKPLLFQVLKGGNVYDSFVLSDPAQVFTVAGSPFGFTYTAAGGDVFTGFRVFASDNDTETYSMSNLQFAAAVPEPETYAMMLVGLGALGFMARRRRVG